LFSDKELLGMYLRSVPKGYDYEVKLSTVPGTDRKQIVISKPKGYEGLNYTNLHTDPLIRLKAMDEAGVDRALLRHPCWEEWFSLEACKKANDLLAKYVSEHSDRVMGLAIAPPWGDEESLDELDRAVKDHTLREPVP
jgi:predicted TIM-barrel fold metal-dependent hydrolase